MQKAQREGIGRQIDIERNDSMIPLGAGTVIFVFRLKNALQVAFAVWVRVLQQAQGAVELAPEVRHRGGRKVLVEITERHKHRAAEGDDPQMTILGKLGSRQFDDIPNS